MMKTIRLKELYLERPKRPKQSDRARPGEPVRLSRTYRLHRDRLMELDELAEYKGISKAATIERLIRFGSAIRRDLEKYPNGVMIEREGKSGWTIRPTEPNHTTDNNPEHDHDHNHKNPGQANRRNVPVACGVRRPCGCKTWQQW